MLVSAARYRQTHREAEATVAIENRKAGRVAHLHYAVDGKPHEITLAEPSRPKERKSFQETYQNGRTASVWYPMDEPKAAEPEGDHGRLIGGIIFTGVGSVFKPRRRAGVRRRVLSESICSVWLIAQGNRDGGVSRAAKGGEKVRRGDRLNCAPRAPAAVLPSIRPCWYRGPAAW